MKNPIFLQFLLFVQSFSSLFDNYVRYSNESNVINISANKNAPDQFP